jgi:hypothetical protein
MNTKSAVIIFSLLFFFISLMSYGGIQQDSPSKHPVNLDSILARVNAQMDHNREDSIMKGLVQASQQDSLLKKALSNYNLFGLTHRQRALQWNLTSSIIIFWSVIFLVFSGIFFAGIQFYISMQNAKKRGSMDPKELDTQLEAGGQGIKVSSPVLGVIILVISMLFFYLYLKYVYPITEIF